MIDDWNRLRPVSEPDHLTDAAESLYRWFTAGDRLYCTDVYQMYMARCKTRGEKRASEYRWEKALILAGLEIQRFNGRRMWIKRRS